MARKKHNTASAKQPLGFEDMPARSLSDAILKLVHHYSDPSDILRILGREFPEASYREFALAALSIMIEGASSDGTLTRHLLRLATSDPLEGRIGALHGENQRVATCDDVRETL